MPQDTQCTYQPFEDSMAAATQMKTAVVNNGIQVYYREAYPAFTTATILAQRYRVLAPDLPGFTVVRTASTSTPCESYTNTIAIAACVDTLNIKKLSLYVFDYGAPTGFRYGP